MDITTQDVINILSLLAVIIIGLRSYYWSKDFKDAKQAQLDEKDEQINTLRLLSSPNVSDAFFSMKKILEEENNNLKASVGEFKQKNHNLESQLENANFKIEELEKEILGIEISDQARSSIRSYTTGSRKALIELGKTANDLKIVEQEIQQSIQDLGEAAVLKIKLQPAKLNVMAEDPVVLITDPDRSKPYDENEDSEKE